MRNQQRDWTTTEYTNVIRINQKDYNFISGKRKKKSAAGFLKQIINFYKKYGDAKLR